MFYFLFQKVSWRAFGAIQSRRDEYRPTSIDVTRSCEEAKQFERRTKQLAPHVVDAHSSIRRWTFDVQSVDLVQRGAMQRENGADATVR